MPGWLLAFVTVGLIGVLVALLAAVRTMHSTHVTAIYPGGVQFLGVKKPGGRTHYRIVSWTANRADRRPCPFVLHLPGGDLGGNALGEWSASARAEKLGGPEELSVSMTHDVAGRPAYVSVFMMFPSRLFGVRPLELSIDGRRTMLPLSDDDLVRSLGEPTERLATLRSKVYDNSPGK
jgi:hypothetical protein